MVRAAMDELESRRVTRSVTVRGAIRLRLSRSGYADRGVDADSGDVLAGVRLEAPGRGECGQVEDGDDVQHDAESGGQDDDIADGNFPASRASFRADFGGWPAVDSAARSRRPRPTRPPRAAGRNEGHRPNETTCWNVGRFEPAMVFGRTPGWKVMRWSARRQESGFGP